MENSLTLSVAEIAFFLSGAMVLGITIRLFIVQRGIRTTAAAEKSVRNADNEAWEKKYVHDLDKRDREIAVLQQQLRASGASIKTIATELNTLRQQYNSFEAAKELLEKKIRGMNKKNYPSGTDIARKSGVAAGV